MMSADIEDNINTSVIQATYSGGLTLNMRTTLYPTADVKEPAEPYSYVTKSIDAIIKGNETILTVNAHGVENTAIVAISGTADGFEFMVNNGFSTVNAGSKLYWVKRVDDNNLRLLAYNGSYDNSLPSRHVHKINEFKEGFVVGMGEDYPYGWVYVIAQLYKDTGWPVHAYKDLGVHRLTSTADAVQRTCGVLIDGGQDATVLAGIDHWTIANRTIEIEGRTSGLFRRTAFGVFKIKMSDIDDFTKAECVCPVPEPVINMKQVGNLILALGQLGGFGISTDGGKSWSYHKRFDSFF